MSKVYYSLMNLMSNDDNIEIYDSLSIDWSSFEWTNGYYLHKISKKEILKPTLLSWAYFGTDIYTDIILAINGIIDIWEVVPGADLHIPKLSDLKRFILKNKK